MYSATFVQLISYLNMNNKITYFLAIFFMLIFMNCTSSKIDKAYFGGQIVNPETDYVVLLQKETPIDTFYLSENNRFSAELNNIKEGARLFTLTLGANLAEKE